MRRWSSTRLSRKKSCSTSGSSGPTGEWCSNKATCAPCRNRPAIHWKGLLKKAAEREARAIAKLLGIKSLTGRRATRQTVVDGMRDAGMVHFATHGLLDDIIGYLTAYYLASIAPARCRQLNAPGYLILTGNHSALIDALFYKQVINADTVEILLYELHDGRLIGGKVSPFKKHLRLPQRPVTLPVIAVHT